jgi:hypothetical protein
MASKSRAVSQITARAYGFDLRKAIRALPVLWAGLLTLLVAAPWLAGGYIFGTDWPGPRRFDFPSELSSLAPLEAVIAAVSRVASAEWTAKLIVLGFLFAAALLAFRAALADGFVPRAVASAVYTLNPFVFGRLHYGQLLILAGYALLPWVALRIHHLVLQPSVKASLLLALSLALVGVLDVHMFLIAGLVVAAMLLPHLVDAAKRGEYLRRVGRSLLLTVGATLLASSYWVFPFVLGRGPIASAVAGIGTPDLVAYAAVPDPQLGLIPNLLGLYGFWAENAGRFTSMKAFVPIWPVALLAILFVSAIGAIGGMRSNEQRLRPWVVGLLVASGVALVLEMGVSNPLTSGLIQWLDSTLPVYRGMRDAGKWAALLALVYSQLFGLGAGAISGWIRKVKLPNMNLEWLGAAAIGVLLALPLYHGNGLLYGMHGEIKPSQYPAGWYAADRVLSSDPHPGRTLFLPWHEYMAYSFVQNQNKVVASPAPSFFSVPIVSSANPEIPGVAPPNDPDQVAISGLVSQRATTDWKPVLAARGIKYVLVAREVDWKSYEFLGQQAGLEPVGDFASIVLYRVNST